MSPTTATADALCVLRRGLQPHAGAVAHPCPAPPPGVPHRHLPHGERSPSPQRFLPTQVALFAFSPADGLKVSMATLRRFHVSHPEVVKVLLAESCDRELAVYAFRSGARGIFCITDASLRLLCKCIQRVASGQVWADAEHLRYLLDSVVEVPSLRVLNSQGDSLLTPREQQVVALVVEGLANRPIARELNLSEHTVKKYLFRIFEKLGVSTRVELVLYAVNHGNSHHAESSGQ